MLSVPPEMAITQKCVIETKLKTKIVLVANCGFLDAIAAHRRARGTRAVVPRTDAIKFGSPSAGDNVARASSQDI